jgi:hypothetical protein
MPITPFHFGPAVIVKTLAPQKFSLLSFGLSQFIIDLEPLYYMSQGQWPIHRFFHTYLGATLVAIVVVLFGKPLCEALLRLWNYRHRNASQQWLIVVPKISFTAATTGAMFGAYSHVFLDSIMHSDIRPLAPLAEGNSLLYLVSIGHLHIVCVLAGVLGGIGLLIQLFRKKSALA